MRFGYRTFDRASWAQLGRGRAPAGAFPPDGSPVTEPEWREVYVPLAHVVGLHLEARSELRRRLGAAGLHGVGAGPFVIGLAGSVSSGKSTAAGALAALIRARPERPAVDVVSTDGFLFPNAVLAERDLLARKGYPETYDAEQIAFLLGSLAEGVSPVDVPRYSHEVYDISGEPQVLVGPDVVILEGINALGSPVGDFCSLGIYLDAAEADLRAWYVDRFLGLIDGARLEPSSFFAQWTGLAPREARALAATVWEQVNLPNLVDHIAPTSTRADIVLRKDATHAVRTVEVRTR